MLLDDLKWRYATKTYQQGKKVPQEDIDKIIEAIRLAPTSSGLQPFRIIVIDDQETKQKLVEGALNPKGIMACSHIIAFAAWDNYTPERIFELSKMDGAIILNDDCSKILYANVHVQPDNSYSTTESGTRHRTAERAAKHLKREVVAISERKKNVTLYKGNLKYRLKNFDELNIEVGQVLKTLESYRHVLNRSLDSLTILELDDLVTVLDVANTLQRFEMVRRISEEITRYLLELGSRGRLVNMQVSELIWDLDEEEESFLKDYIDNERDTDSVRRYLHSLSDSELLEIENVVVALGYSKSSSVLDNKIAAKGYRVLEKISKLTKKDIEKIVNTYKDISEIQEVTDEDLSAVFLYRRISKNERIRRFSKGIYGFC